MSSIPQFERRCGRWAVQFSPATAEFECRHSATTARVSGVLRFERRSPDGAEGWSIESARDAATDRLALVDPDGNVQGYVVFCGDADRLEILAVHRAAQAYAGRLLISGCAELGENTFACRTSADRASRVVQMASGPADSALNDSLFDIDIAKLLNRYVFKVETIDYSFKVSMTKYPEHLHAEYDGELSDS